LTAVDSLARAGHILATAGPHKWENSPKRIRVLLSGETILDSTETRLVWEHPYYPQYYLPTTALKNATLEPGRETEDGTEGYRIHDVTVHGTTTKDAILTIETGPLDGFLRVTFSKMQAIFEEDEPVHGHPVDPYKRVDTRRSSRPIRVEVNGVEIASASWAVHLYETSLPVRYYLPRTSVKAEMLRSSNTRTYCPYKGSANYFHVVTRPDSAAVQDIVWYYETPLLAVNSIRELVSAQGELLSLD
jgi:uncharacterized protein (DUF427 family)